MYDVTKMSQAEITECSNALGALGAGAGSMEAAANRVVRHLYDNLVDPATTQKSCALVRFYKTHHYSQPWPAPRW